MSDIEEQQPTIPAEPEKQNGEEVKETTESKSSHGPLAAVRNFLSHPKNERKIPGSAEMKPAIAADGVSGFIERLVRKGIVSQKMVDDALAFRKTQHENDKRKLFQILIEEFDADREKVYTEFADYYSFKTFDLESVQMSADRISFINKTFNTLPP